MAGYSKTPLAKKLGIKPQTSLVTLHAPEDFFDQTLQPCPEELEISNRAAGPADVVMLFCIDRALLRRRFAAAAKAVAEGGRLWLCWPKKAGSLKTDLDGAAIRDWGLERGWVDYKVAAVDADWSGHCFARRR